MKFNLKNREKCCIHQDLREKCPVERWFEGFEKEVREQLKRKKFLEKGYCPIWDNAYDYALKQILGE